VGEADAATDADPADVALAWAQMAYPNAWPDFTDASNGVSVSATFWNLVDAMQDQPGPAKETLLFFVGAGATFPAEPFAAMVNGLGIDGLQCDAPTKAPLTALHVSLAPDWTRALDCDDELADGAEARMRAWVDDVIVDSHVCPYTKSNEVAGTGLEQAGVVAGAIHYPLCVVSGAGGPALARLLRAFWLSTINLLSAPPEEVSTLLICAPGYAVDDADAFAAACTAITTNLKFVRADFDVSLVFFHPKYDRDRVAPDPYEQAHGHLPPVPWLRAYAALDRGADAAAELTDDALHRANAQRTSPFFCINVLRTDQVEAAESVLPWEVIEPEPGRSIRVSGARVYAKNICRFADAATTKVNKFGDTYLVAKRGAIEPEG